jgi:hypothetical protein
MDTRTVLTITAAQPTLSAWRLYCSFHSELFMCVFVSKRNKTCICIRMRKLWFTNYGPDSESKLNFMNCYFWGFMLEKLAQNPFCLAINLLCQWVLANLRTFIVLHKIPWIMMGHFFWDSKLTVILKHSNTTFNACLITKQQDYILFQKFTAAAHVKKFQRLL